jgi:hypothetical protein
VYMVYLNIDEILISAIFIWGFKVVHNNVTFHYNNH